MSYNTRRTGGGRGQTTQVNYHQQPSRPGSNVTQQTRNPGYTTTQSANYNSTSQPAYSTQQPGYTTAPPMPAQAAAPPPPPQTQPQQPAPQPPLPTQQPPSTPSLKKEPVTPAGTPQSQGEETPTTENGDATQTKPFWRKKPFMKLSNKVKRARMNAKLRRVLNPKNALTFLNELRPGGVKFAVREEAGWGFVAAVDIDGKTFSGNGMTVSKAKVQASEQALRHILLEQLAKSEKAASSISETADDTTERDELKNEEGEGEHMNVDSEGGDGEEPKKKKPRMELPEDDLPWGSLAAFALHKLFDEWQKGGTTVPVQEKYDEDIGDDSYFRRPGPPEFGYPRRFPPNPGMYGRGRGFAPFPVRGGGFNGPRRPPVPPASNFLNNPPRPTISLGNPTSSLLPMKKIPDDANKRHPVMLLNQLKPNLVYNEFREGETPHVMFRISVEINGQEYVGRGKSKKDAKKMAAKAALAPMGIAYDD